MCLFKSWFDLKLALQASHLNGFFFSCTFKRLKNQSHKCHIWHLNGIFPSWTKDTCDFKLIFCEKVEQQMSHLNGFFSFMNWNYVSFQISFWFKTRTTNITCVAWLATTKKPLQKTNHATNLSIKKMDLDKGLLLDQ